MFTRKSTDKILSSFTSTIKALDKHTAKSYRLECLWQDLANKCKAVSSKHAAEADAASSAARKLTNLFK